VTKEEIKNPPKLAEWILSCVYPDKGDFTSVGDFREEFLDIYQSSGPLKANLWYWKQIAKSIPHFVRNKSHWSIVMIQNYLKITLRNIKRHKGYSFINIAGLSIGLACSIIILLWVQDELSFDRFHENADRIQRIVADWEKYNWDGFDKVPGPLALAINEEIPSILQVARISECSRQVFKYKNNVFYENNGIIADPSLFKIFSFPFLRGDLETSFSDPSNIVISESMARKYFGEEDGFGKTIEVDGKSAVLAGIIKDIPPNSHIQFDYVFSTESDKNYGTNWNAFNSMTYVLLQEGANVEELGPMITEVAKNHNSPHVQMGVSLRFQPLSRIHLDARKSPEKFLKLGDSQYIYLFSIIAFFILLIACVNFMNLSTARSSMRAREVGIRKTVGGKKGQLIRQFLAESIILSCLSCMIAIALTNLFIPTFNQISEKKMTFHLIELNHILGILAIILFVGLLAGAYPAIYLSSLKPVFVLKGAIGSGRRKAVFRKVLVVFQFSLSVMLIIGTVVVHKQLQYVRNKNLGLDKENVIFLPIRENIGKQFDTFKKELLENSGILQVTATNYMFAIDSWHTTGVHWEGKDPEYMQDVVWHSVDYDFFETLKMELKEGRLFSPEFQTDPQEAFILNEEAVRQMGIESPVGKPFVFALSQDNFKKGRIIGVLKDGYYRSLHHKISPHVFHLNRNWTYGVILVRIAGEHALSHIKNIWEKINPVSPFEFQFLEQTYEKLYRKEAQIRKVLNYFASLAILISCLGLFGLASFMTEQRTKEIGIRKVLGSPVSWVVWLLSQEFLKCVGLANLIAWPIAYYALRKWLQNFAYKTNIGVGILLFSAALAVFIAFLTVGYQSIKAANANPVDSLRYE
jgi:ABC-type antimicrobial peptide transport system permease subunit